MMLKTIPARPIFCLHFDMPGYRPGRRKQGLGDLFRAIVAQYAMFRPGTPDRRRLSAPLASGAPFRKWVIEGGCRQGAVDHGLGHLDERSVVVAGVGAQRGERLFHVEVLSLGNDPLGLFDDDATVERVVELLVEDLGLERGTMLKDRKSVV